MLIFNHLFLDEIKVKMPEKLPTESKAPFLKLRHVLCSELPQHHVRK